MKTAMAMTSGTFRRCDAHRVGCRAARLWLVSVVLCHALGCGPTPPKVVLETPKDAAATWQGRKLYHTPQGYIYARDDLAAGEADRWLTDVKKYIRRTHGRELEKGIVIVRDPGDENVARTLEEEWAIEHDPKLFPTQPRHSHSLAESRKKLADEGVPESPMVRGATLALSSARMNQMGLPGAIAIGGVSAPSHQLALDCGIDVSAAAVKKKRPDLSDEQAHAAANKVARLMPELVAKAFEMPRGGPVFIMWVERQKDWTDTQRCDAILAYLKHSMKENGIDPPKDNEELEW